MHCRFTQHTNQGVRQNVVSATTTVLSLSREKPKTNHSDPKRPKQHQQKTCTRPQPLTCRFPLAPHERGNAVLPPLARGQRPRKLVGNCTKKRLLPSCSLSARLGSDKGMHRRRAGRGEATHTLIVGEGGERRSHAKGSPQPVWYFVPSRSELRHRQSMRPFCHTL